MEYHIIAFFSGFLLDLMFGDPYWMFDCKSRKMFFRKKEKER